MRDRTAELWRTKEIISARKHTLTWFKSTRKDFGKRIKWFPVTTNWFAEDCGIKTMEFVEKIYKQWGVVLYLY